LRVLFSKTSRTYYIHTNVCTYMRTYASKWSILKSMLRTCALYGCVPTHTHINMHIYIYIYYTSLGFNNEFYLLTCIHACIQKNCTYLHAKIQYRHHNGNSDNCHCIYIHEYIYTYIHTQLPLQIDIFYIDICMHAYVRFHTHMRLQIW
jgi:hypothetical protein